MQPACLELWEQNSYQALGWRAGMEGFDKPGQLGARCQLQHIPAAARAVLSAHSLPAFFREMWLPDRHPRWILEALSHSQLLFLCAWVLGIPGQGNKLDVTSSNNPS